MNIPAPNPAHAPGGFAHIMTTIQPDMIAVSFELMPGGATAVITLGHGVRLDLTSPDAARALAVAASDAAKVLDYHAACGRPLPPLRATSHELPSCASLDHGWICTAQAGHDGDHTVYGPDGTVLHTWETRRPEVTA